MTAPPRARARFTAWLRKKRRRQVAFVVLLVLLFIALAAALALCYLLFCLWGAFGPADNPYSFMPRPVAQKDLRMVYDGVEYVYDPDVVNILLIGVDEENYNADPLANYHGGYADTLMVCSYNRRSGQFTLIPLPRDAQAPLAIPQYAGSDEVGLVVQGPICLAHGYGRDRVQSARFTMASVSYFFYGLPLHGYVSIKIEALRAATDYVGGVPIQVRADFTEVIEVPPDTEVLLDGELAEQYVRGRSMSGMSGDNLDRMVRQRQFLLALVGKLSLLVKQDALFAWRFYRDVAAPHTVTDLSLRELCQLAYSYMKGGSLNLRVMAGEMRDGVYVPDEAYTRALVRELCFVPVET